MNNADWQARKVAAIARGQGNIAPVYIERGENAELWDVEGNRYIDFGTGIAVCNTGHSNPKVVAAVQEQLQRFSHTCVMVTPYDTAIRLAEKLTELAPGDSPKKTMFVTTGAEAVEDSIKALNNLFKVDIAPSDVAAIIVELVQGEGGFYAAPNEFMQALRKVCDEHGIVMIADEIQTGFGRTGKFFASEYAGIEPDLLTTAKGLADRLCGSTCCD